MLRKMIFAARNLTEQSVAPAIPWEFTPTETITDQIRTDKPARQKWYRLTTTRHLFYTLVEGANPRQRASKENPPRLLHGIVADYDLPVAPERAQEFIATTKLKPSWMERSIGGNMRLVFLFPRPLPVDTVDFARYIFEKAVSWLALELLPGLDRGAALDPHRLYCCGGPWTEIVGSGISETALQAFFVDSAREFRFTPPANVEIPLDAVEKALKEKYSNFNWPGDFLLESSGPSFFVEGSQSSNSAILKPDGFLTFSAHADKPFYSWLDLLGADFVKGLSDEAISKATSDVWHDGRKFWRKKKGCYVAMEASELTNYLKIDCGISAKGKQLEAALSHIYNENFVENASPYLFRPPGLITYQGRRRLNTAMNILIQPATSAQTWGPSGSFPFLSALLDNIFTSEVQRDNFLAWFSYFYGSGLNSSPMPGPVVFFMGGVATGKTFTSREIVGRSVGGYVDAASYIIRGGEFNSHLFEYPLWVMDDDAISDSPQAAANVQAMLKKSVANNSFLSNKKFQVAGQVEWSGRVIATTNTDYISSRMLGPLDNSSLDKISVFRCQKTSQIKFPSRPEMERLVSTELPFMLRWLVDHTPPEHVERDVRFGFKSWHESSLMDQATQTSKSAPFKEILIETLEEYFKDSPEALEWRGTVSQLIQQMHLNPLREAVIRTLRLEAVARYLESIERDGNLKCRAETGALNTRVWIFPRIGPPPPQEFIPPPFFQQPGPSIFDK